MTGQLFSPCTLVSSTNKTGGYAVAEILLKVALNTMILTVCVNWLTVCCLTTSGRYFKHIQDENKFNNIYKIYRGKSNQTSGSTTANDKI